MSFSVYRLTFGDPLNFYEQLGDPVTSSGGAPVPASRSALRHAVSLATFDNAQESVTSRLKLRRQWRSLANNTPMKLQGVWLNWDADPENSGWYMPDQGQLVDIEGAVGLATGIWKVENTVWIAAGKVRTHRRAMWVYLKDLRTGVWARDFRRLIYATDFAGLSPLALSYFPPSSSDFVTTGGNATVPVAIPVGADGGACLVSSALLDLARVSFEQIKVARTQGCVVAYDRHGEQTGPTGGPGASWEEFYGPDYPYSWTEGLANDVPVIENGRCRLRFDATATAGFIIDVWTGTKWEEQGKVIIGRLAEEAGKNPFLTVLSSAALVEYSETRVVVQCVMKTNSGNATLDSLSREEVFITLQRGWSGPRFEVYTSPKTGGVLVDAYVVFTCAVNDADDSAAKVDIAGAGGIFATAQGAGHTGKWSPAAIGNPQFVGENWVSLGRWGAPYGVTFAVHKASASPATTGSEAYGGGGLARNGIQIQGVTKDAYLSVQLGFPPQLAQQAQEAEAMTLAAGTTSVADAEASGSEKAAQAERTTTTFADQVTQTKWPNADEATYRVFARVRNLTSVSCKVRAKTGATTGATATFNSATYVWVDLGDIVANNTTLHIETAAASAVKINVDRIEAFLVEDRLAAVGQYLGARDLGQAVLYDSRVIPTLVSRTT